MRTKHFHIHLALGLGLLTLAGVLALLWMAGRPALADTTANVFYVAPSGNDAPGCGSESAPCQTIQYAVDMASNGDEIRIAATDNSIYAVYTGTGDNVVELRKSITLRGGYVYMHLINSTWLTSPVPSRIDGEHARRPLFVSGDITPSLELLAFQNGQAERGGNVYAENAHLRFVGTPIMSGTAAYGGGLYLKNCTVSFDVGNLDVGGLLEGVSGLVPVLNNSAQYGGGVYIESGNPVIAGIALLYNVASEDGGGFYINGGRPTIAGGLVRENRATGRGGGFFLGDSPARIAAVSVYSNTAATGAGFFLDGPFSFNPLNVPVIANNYIRHNHTTSGDGGAFYFNETIAGLVNNIVADNVIPIGQEGAAMYLFASSPVFYHNTVANNQGHSGIYVTHKPAQTTWPPTPPVPSYPAFTNTIIVSQTETALYVDTTGLPAPLENSVSLYGTLWYANGSDTGGSGSIAHSTDVYGDPRFVCTGDLPNCLRPYHIMTGSLAMDAGVPVGLSFSDDNLFVDIDFQLRPSGEGYDIGADEVVSESFSVWLVPPASFLRVRPGEVATHVHKLMNTGLQTDVYTLNVRTTAGWSQLVGDTVITLSPQTSRTVAVRVTVPETATNRMRDTAFVTATSRSDPTKMGVAVDVAEVVTTSAPSTDLAVSKRADVAVIPGGEPVRFTVIVTNTGPLTGSLVVTLTDTAVPTVAVGGWRLPPGCSQAAGLASVVCTRTLAGGSVPATTSLSLVITTTDAFSGPLANLVQVAAAGVQDTNPLNDYSLATVRLTTTTCISVSEVTISGPTAGYTGTRIPFAAHVNVNASRPVTFTWRPQPPHSLLLPGVSVVTYTWDTPGVKTITVTAENCGGAQATAVHTITIYGTETPLADLSVSKRANVTTTQAGGPVQYTIVFTKSGALSNTLTVTLTDTLVPTNAFSLLRWPPNCTGTVSSGQFACHWSLPPSSLTLTRVFTVTLTTTEVFSGLLDNRVVVNGDVLDPLPTNNTALATVRVQTEAPPRWSVYLPLVLRED